MTQPDWGAEDEQYDHDLVAVLDILHRTNINQLLNDVRKNDPKAYDMISAFVHKEYLYA